MISDSQMRKAQYAHERAAEAELDRKAEEDDMRQEAIEARVARYWQDKEAICRVIEEIMDELNHINDTDYDVIGSIELAITRVFTAEAEADSE